jgi:hypothetical protein
LYRVFSSFNIMIHNSPLLHVAGLDHFSLYNDFIPGINCLLNLSGAGQTYVIFACLFFLTIVIISYFSVL